MVCFISVYCIRTALYLLYTVLASGARMFKTNLQLAQRGS